MTNQVEAEQDCGDQEARHADEQAPNAAGVVQPGVVGAQDADEVDEVKSLKNLVNRWNEKKHLQPKNWTFNATLEIGFSNCGCILQ